MVSEKMHDENYAKDDINKATKWNRYWHSTIKMTCNAQEDINNIIRYKPKPFKRLFNQAKDVANQK